MNPDPPAAVSPESVLRAARRGDREGFERLMLAEKEGILRVASEFLDDRLRRVVDPEDVVQDVFFSAYLGLQTARFPTLEAFRGWLHKLARNRLIDLRRRHLAAKRGDGRPLSLEESRGESPSGAHRSLRDLVPAPDPSPSSIATRKEAAEGLEAVLARLPAHYRSVIRLVELERISTEEISLRFGRSPAAVRKLLERALRACRAEMLRSGTLRPAGEKRPR